MEAERLEKLEKIIADLEKRIADLTTFIRTMWLAVLFIEVVAFGAMLLAVVKIGEFWMVDSRNMYQRIEQLEGEHDDKGR